MRGGIHRIDLDDGKIRKREKRSTHRVWVVHASQKDAGEEHEED